MKCVFFIIMFSMTCFTVKAQEEQFSPAIEDNSMFIEEAYNQEDRIVQHISNLVFVPNLRDDFFYAFTQEWPAFGLKHQLSYTVQYNSFSRRQNTGFGDVLLNYRYQLSYKDDFVTSSPRISLIVPAGDENKGLGMGSLGFQGNLPISKRWSNQFINHFNLGTTVLYRLIAEEDKKKENLVNYFAGIGSIWLLKEKFNIMLEALATADGYFTDEKKLIYYGAGIISPGFRYAIDIKELQIVSGISLPFTFVEGAGTEMGVFFYLSFEHPY